MEAAPPALSRRQPVDPGLKSCLETEVRLLHQVLFVVSLQNSAWLDGANRNWFTSEGNCGYQRGEDDTDGAGGWEHTTQMGLDMNGTGQARPCPWCSERGQGTLHFLPLFLFSFSPSLSLSVNQCHFYNQKGKELPWPPRG